MSRSWEGISKEFTPLSLQKIEAGQQNSTPHLRVEKKNESVASKMSQQNVGTEGGA